MVGKDPADSPHSRRCSYNAIQSDLPYLNKVYDLERSIDYKMVEDVLVSVDEKRI